MFAPVKRKNNIDKHKEKNVFFCLDSLKKYIPKMVKTTHEIIHRIKERFAMTGSIVSITGTK